MGVNHSFIICQGINETKKVKNLWSNVTAEFAKGLQFLKAREKTKKEKNSPKTELDLDGL